jgi:hypothetical protein
MTITICNTQEKTLAEIAIESRKQARHSFNVTPLHSPPRSLQSEPMKSAENDLTLSPSLSSPIPSIAPSPGDFSPLTPRSALLQRLPPPSDASQSVYISTELKRKLAAQSARVSSATRAQAKSPPYRKPAALSVRRSMSHPDNLFRIGYVPLPQLGAPSASLGRSADQDNDEEEDEDAEEIETGNLPSPIFYTPQNSVTPAPPSPLENRAQPALEQREVEEQKVKDQADSLQFESQQHDIHKEAHVGCSILRTICSALVTSPRPFKALCLVQFCIWYCSL